MNNPAKTFVFLSVISICLLVTGYSLYGRQGLLAGFSIALSLNFFIYFYSDHRLQDLFKGRELEGRDPWNLLKFLSEIASKAKIPIPRLILIETKTPTAFSIGHSHRSSIVFISQGIVDHFEPDEIRAIIAHEIGHIKRLDILSFAVSSAMAGACLSLAAGVDKFIRWLFQMKTSGPGFFTKLFTPIADAIVRLSVNPKCDFEADKFAAASIGSPEPLARSLWKLKSYANTQPINVPVSAAHLFIVNPLTTRGTNNYFHTQPAIENRIQELIGRYPI